MWYHILTDLLKSCDVYSQGHHIRLLTFLMTTHCHVQWNPSIVETIGPAKVSTIYKGFHNKEAVVTIY